MNAKKRKIIKHIIKHNTKSEISFPYNIYGIYCVENPVRLVFNINRHLPYHFVLSKKTIEKITNDGNIKYNFFSTIENQELDIEPVRLIVNKHKKKQGFTSGLLFENQNNELLYTVKKNKYDFVLLIPSDNLFNVELLNLLKKSNISPIKLEKIDAKYIKPFPIFY